MGQGGRGARAVASDWALFYGVGALTPFPVPTDDCGLLLGCEATRVAREAIIFKVEGNGSESCELATNSSFVCVCVPIRIEGEGREGEATFHYSIGSFSGRDTPLPLREGLHTTLRFRIPLELFRARERFAVEVLAGGASSPEKIVWAKRWEVIWRGRAPDLEALAE